MQQSAIMALICTAALLGPAGAVAAPTTQTTEPVNVVQALPALSDIIDRNLSARGGEHAWHGIQAMSLTGHLDAGRARPTVTTTLDRAGAKALAKAELRDAELGKSNPLRGKVIKLPFRLDLARPMRSRLEIAFQGDTAVQVYDGAAGWKLRPFLGRHQVEPFSAEELKSASEQQALDGPLIDYQTKGTQVALEGADTVEGHKAYRLALTLKDGEKRHLWIDAQTYLDLRIDEPPRRLDGRLRQVQTTFRDYRPVNGVMISHQLETTVEGISGSQKVVFEQVVLNPTLDPARFAAPQ